MATPSARIRMSAQLNLFIFNAAVCAPALSQSHGPGSFWAEIERNRFGLFVALAAVHVVHLIAVWELVASRAPKPKMQVLQSVLSARFSFLSLSATLTSVGATVSTLLLFALPLLEGEPGAMPSTATRVCELVVWGTFMSDYFDLFFTNLRRRGSKTMTYGLNVLMLVGALMNRRKHLGSLL